MSAHPFKTVEIISDPNLSGNLVLVRETATQDEYWVKRTSLRRDSMLGVWILLSERQLTLIERGRARQRSRKAEQKEMTANQESDTELVA